ncbi:50S ribosomal protein L7/L12 [Candidatus Tremblaya phenacola]|uniref:Large ribosomal subunit protein bL12 n=1 Tax=Candidatus Tremblayella phenacoccinincola TaxID=1010676 RepID=A0A2G0V6X9_9PROT|nr:50S ribosomal protein L7/L12 [Candidatus Tremblaya phenacola]PHN16223.1 50S ribosomal protein L7/L12 [Candidatus Tremblaya phenacola]
MQTKDELLKQIESMSVTELNELIEALAKRFNISSSLTNLKANVNTKGQKANDNLDSKEFKVVLTDVGNNKIAVIKIIREVSGLGLKESKDIVENVPKLIKKNLNKMQAEEVKAKIETVGAKANVE